MGATLIKKDYRNAVNRVKHFRSMVRTGGAYVTLAYDSEGKLLGAFADHEAAARYCEVQGVQFGELKSEPVRT